MGERIENKCPSDHVFIIENGKGVCIPPPSGPTKGITPLELPRRSRSFFGCNLDLARAAHEVKDDDNPYCAPCFTLKYACLETGSITRTRSFCPEIEPAYDHPKPQREVFEEAARLLKNFNLGKGCTILNAYEYKLFKEWIQEETTQHLTRTAEYQCQTPTSVGRETASESTVTKEIVIDLPGNATKETIRAEFEAAARKLEKTIAGCWNVHFERVLNETPTPPPQIPEAVKKEASLFEDPCIGPWKNRPVCKK